MKLPCFGLLLTLAVSGCMRGPVTVTVTTTPTPPTSPSAKPAESTQSSQPAAYPEKVEVERLLYRARELEQSGQFTNALAIVNQALQIDARSPSATTLRNHLEEIIKRS